MEQLAAIRRIAARQDWVVTAAQCRAVGLSPTQVAAWCRGKTWLRLNRGAYFVDADLRGDPARAAIIRAALLSAGSDAVAVLETAAEIHGIAGLRHDETVHVSLPGGLARPHRLCDTSLRMHQLVISRHDLVQVRGLTVTSITRTAADLVLRHDRYTSVALLDSALNRGLLRPNDLTTVADLMTGRRGAGMAKSWLAEADGRAQSPLETRIRLRCVDGKVPPDTLQHPVYNESGKLLGIGDLAWLRAKLIAEGDGRAAHDNPTALFRDRRRQNDLINAGYRLTRFTWEDTIRPRYVPQVILHALAEAA